MRARHVANITYLDQQFRYSILFKVASHKLTGYHYQFQAYPSHRIVPITAAVVLASKHKTMTFFGLSNTVQIVHEPF